MLFLYGYLVRTSFFRSLLESVPIVVFYRPLRMTWQLPQSSSYLYRDPFLPFSVRFTVVVEMTVEILAYFMPYKIDQKQGQPEQLRNVFPVSEPFPEPSLRLVLGKQAIFAGHSKLVRKNILPPRTIYA